MLPADLDFEIRQYIGILSGESVEIHHKISYSVNEDMFDHFLISNYQIQIIRTKVFRICFTCIECKII